MTAINPGSIDELLKRGYTVFAVVHGSQPRFTIPEIVKDMNRAVRFIRFHAKDYHIDPDRIGITGGSAGGHLSLMQGTAGDTGDKNAKDPVDQTSSRVQAVGCFFPAHGFSQLRQARRDRDRLRRAEGLQTAVRLPRARPEYQDVCPDHRPGQDPRNRPPDQPGLLMPRPTIRPR